MNTNFLRTYHAWHRQARRNLSDQDVDFVFEHGRHIHCAGVLHIFLGKRDIPCDKETYQRFAHLEGTVLVLSASQGIKQLITTYRNRQGLKKIRRKTKYEQSFT